MLSWPRSAGCGPDTALRFATSGLLSGERRVGVLLKVPDRELADTSELLHLPCGKRAFLFAEPESQKQQGCQGPNDQELSGK